MPSELSVSSSSLSRYGRSTATASFGRPISESTIARWRSIRLAARAVLGRALEGAEDSPDVALAPQNHREVRVAELHPRVLGDDLAGHRQRFVALPAIAQLHDRVELLVDGDERLRVVLRAVGLLRLSGSRQVAEAPQLGGLLRADRAPLARRRGQLEQPLAQPPQGVGRLGDEVLRFPGIRRKVVELRNRQVDVLVSARRHAPERRPAAVEGRRERLEVAALLGLLAAGAAEATARSAPPASARRRRRGSSGGCRCGAPGRRPARRGSSGGHQAKSGTCSVDS